MKRLVPCTILVCGIIVYWVSTNIQYGKDHWKAFVDSDGKGYFSYLPAIFIYQDLNFGFFDEIEKNHFTTHQDYRNIYKGKVIDKYYCGTAVAMTPFYLMGHLVTLMTNQPVDGYSYFYSLSVNVAALFYLLASFLFLAKLLRLYGTSEKIIAFIIVAFTFGTNFFYYVVIEPSMSHIYSLFFISVFLYYSKLWFTAPQDKYLIYLAASLGMIALIRPVNVIIVGTLPFIAERWPVLVSGLARILKNKMILLVSALIFFAICSIQLIIYKIQTGDFIVFSYTTEKFLWDDPKMFKILFGYRKGLFVYTPMVFIALAGLIWVYKNSKFQFYSILIFFTALTYLLSSWWCWWYGGSFGMRAFLEFFPLFIILFALAFHVFEKKYLRIGYITLAVLLILVCQIQTYQKRYYYIHWGEMTKEQYWRVFLRIDWALAGTHKQPTDLPVRQD